MQNQELVMNLGNRYYQVIYPIQMRRQGLDTRDRRNQGYGKVLFLNIKKRTCIAPFKIKVPL